MPATLRELEFGALFAYSPRPDSELALRSKRLCSELKRDGFTRPRRDADERPQIVSEWVAERIRARRSQLPFADFFGPNVTVVPAPAHGARVEEASVLWVPQRLCDALVRVGLARRTAACLERTSSVLKSALVAPDERPTVAQHLASMRVVRDLESVDEVVLVDDVVTRGAMLMASAIRILEAFPNARVRAFAVMRTMSEPGTFVSVDAPCLGKIEHYASGKTHREP